MFKLLSDTFIVKEITGSNSSETLLENEIYISDDMPNIEKIISTEGKIKITDITVQNNKVIVNGELNYTIIYRSNHDEVAICPLRGKVNFQEEVQISNAKENMDAEINMFIDYIEAEMESETKILLKAVANMDVELINKRSVDFISNLESDGSFQAKTKNIKYTDVVNNSSEEFNISDEVELNQNSNQISNIIKADGSAYITNVDIMNERMLIEGICTVGFLYTEDNNLSTAGYITEEFPFTHYIEIKNTTDDMLREITIDFKDLTYSIEENYDKENKKIVFSADFNINAKLFDTVVKNLITDGYSTKSEVEIIAEKINLVSTKNIKDSIIKYENSFDVMSGTIKDIYTTNISPKISEKRVFDDKYVIDGFLDVNLLYLNGDVNKVDRAFASIPFTTTINLDDGEKDYDLTSNLSINKCNAYRKGNNSVMFNCDIKVSMKFKDKDEISVISDIKELGPIDYNLMPSLVFRVVQSGETLWDIAKNYNVSINYLNELNELSQDSPLIAGKKIIITRKA